MDYAHARHAGNVGDVFKHLALVGLLEELARDAGPLRYVETHAADGLFPLGSAGEWGAGIQSLWDVEGADLLARYVALVRRWSAVEARRPGKYPGSPLLAQALLRPQDSLLLHEIDAQSAGVLRRSLGDDARADVREADGLAALPDAVAASPDAGALADAVAASPDAAALAGALAASPDAAAASSDALAGADRSFALVDAPYTEKGEWAAVARAVVAARARAPQAVLAIWYPIKALTRPRGLLAALVEGGVHGTVVELLSTPLRLKREKLNGSGMIFSGAPSAAIASLCASLVRLGPLVATHGEWSATQIGF